MLLQRQMLPLHNVQHTEHLLWQCLSALPVSAACTTCCWFGAYDVAPQSSADGALLCLRPRRSHPSCGLSPGWGSWPHAGRPVLAQEWHQHDLHSQSSNVGVGTDIGGLKVRAREVPVSSACPSAPFGRACSIIASSGVSYSSVQGSTRACSQPTCSGSVSSMPSMWVFSFLQWAAEQLTCSHLS